MIKDYTDRLDGFQIRDVTYFGSPPVGAPPSFDVVKWKPEKNPHVETVYYTDDNGDIRHKEKLITEYCYSVGFLRWNEHESDFDFESVGLRWIEAKPSSEVCNMILWFCEEKGKEIRERNV